MGQVTATQTSRRRRRSRSPPAIKLVNSIGAKVLECVSDFSLLHPFLQRLLLVFQRKCMLMEMVKLSSPFPLMKLQQLRELDWRTPSNLSQSLRFQKN